MTSDYLLLQGDARRIPLADGSVHCVVTSPPYFGLRDYGTPGQIGLEATPDAFVASMVRVFREVWRILREDGTLWLNLGDSYNNAGSSRNGEGLDGSRRGGATGADGECGYRKRDLRHALKGEGIKHKDLIGIPWRVALALQADGWYLRSDIIWSKPNPMPESVSDRPTKAHEYIFLLTKSDRYFYDADAIREPLADATVERGEYGHNHVGKGQFKGSPTDERHQNGKQVEKLSELYNPLGRNKRSVWEVSVASFSGAHFATFPAKLIEPCIKAGSPKGGIVFDPFNGAATTGVVALAHGRRYIGTDLNPEYLAMSRRRIERPHAPVQRAKTVSPLDGGKPLVPLPGQRSLFDALEEAAT